MHRGVGMFEISICIHENGLRHSINYQARYGGNPPYSHVQSMAYALRQEVLSKLIASGLYHEDRDSTTTLAIEDY